MSHTQTDFSYLSQIYGATGPLTLAVSAKWFTFPTRVHWLTEQSFALEYTPNPDAFHQVSTHLTPFLEDGVRVRHHGFFPGYEIGDQNAERAQQAMRVHYAALDAMQGYGEQVITMHVGVTKDIQLDSGRIVENLSRLVEYGQERGITVSLENLRHGPTSHPETVLQWAVQSGSMITLDVGHAVSNKQVLNNELTVYDFITLFEKRLIEVHFYEKETDRHYAPQDMTILGPIVDQLLETECSWWTIELDDYNDILQTRLLIYKHLNFLREFETEHNNGLKELSDERTIR